MGRWVPPAFGTSGIGWARLPGGPVVTSECGGYVSRRSVAFGACCCAETRASRRGHVTWSRFERGVSSRGGARAGVVQGASGSLLGAWAVVPHMGRCVVGLGRQVVRCWGLWWVPGSRRGWCWGWVWVAYICVLTLCTVAQFSINFPCPVSEGFLRCLRLVRELSDRELPDRVAFGHWAGDAAAVLLLAFERHDVACRVVRGVFR